MNQLNERLGRSVFTMLEVPADFIKNITEENKTGLSLGSMLTDERHVRQLYDIDDTDRTNLKFILHTEPGLSRTGSGRVTPKLEWYDPIWLGNFRQHLFNIIDWLGHLPYAIEIHPGTTQRGDNSYHALAKAIDFLVSEYVSKYKADVLVFIENRTGQIIQSGSSMAEFWNHINYEFPRLAKCCGYTLDVQQLFTVTRKDFVSELNMIPEESLKGCHVHTKHRVPSITDEIGWEQVANKLQGVEQELHILPEVHHFEHTEKTYLFCKNVLGF